MSELMSTAATQITEVIRLEIGINFMTLQPALEGLGFRIETHVFSQLDVWDCFWPLLPCAFIDPRQRHSEELG